jgi:hypothetical protein
VIKVVCVASGALINGLHVEDLFTSDTFGRLEKIVPCVRLPKDERVRRLAKALGIAADPTLGS